MSKHEQVVSVYEKYSLEAIRKIETKIKTAPNFDELKIQADMIQPLNTELSTLFFRGQISEEGYKYTCYKLAELHEEANHRRTILQLRKEMEYEKNCLPFITHNSDYFMPNSF